MNFKGWSKNEGASVRISLKKRHLGLPILISLFLITPIVLLIGEIWKRAASPDVEIFVDNNLIYRGNAACINPKSAGFNTMITTYKGFLCFIPDKLYVSKDVVVNTVLK